MPFRKNALKYRRRPRRRVATRKVLRPRYRGGYSRFGKISQPELKSKTLQRAGTTAASQTQDIPLTPSITQGISEAERIGNRINGKFSNTKLMLSYPKQGEIKG